jgi:adenosylmethionine-8-amino-7-oxononanoate aminotransferase
MPYVLQQSHLLAHWPADGFCNEPLVRMSEELLTHLPDHFGHVFTNTGGSEAVETALRISRAYHRRRGEGSRHRVIACAGGYHGSTLGALSVTGLAALRRDTGPLLEGVFFLDLPTSADPNDVEQALQAADRLVGISDPSTISCFLFEPTLGLGGMRPLPAKYLEGLCDIAHSAGALVVLDEVASGLGRTGRWFDFTRSSICPDIVVCGKALSNGTVPLSATVSSKELMEVLCDHESGFSHGHTYSGHPLCAEAGYRVLVALEKLGVIRNVQRRAADFDATVTPRMNRLDIVREVRCAGLWVGIECHHPDPTRTLNIQDLSRQLVCRGILHERLGSTLAFSPPLTIGPRDFETLFQVVYDTLACWEFSDEPRRVASDVTS